MGWFGCVHYKKIPTRLHGTNFCTSSARFAPSFVRPPNGPGCTQIVRNAPKCQFRVQWGGSVAFVAKNSVATSWHELLHQIGKLKYPIGPDSGTTLHPLCRIW